MIIAALAAAGAVAYAAPPTVTPSPGYDARLQEQRAAAASAATPTHPPVVTRHPKKTHTH
jgi:hypothetical protein